MANHQPADVRWVVGKPYKRARGDKKSKHYYVSIRDNHKEGTLAERTTWVCTKQTNRTDATEYARTWIRDQENKEKGVTPTGLNFETEFEEWLSLKSLKDSTRYNYEKDLAGVYAPEFGDKNVNEITRRDIKRFLKKLDDRGQSVRNRRKHLIQLRSFFEELVDDDRLSKNPCRKVKAGTGTKREGVALDFDQATALLAACRQSVVVDVTDGRPNPSEAEEQLFFAIAASLYTGLRRANIVGLRWKYVDLAKRKLSIPGDEMKAKRDHELPIHPVLMQLFRNMLRDRDRVDPEELVVKDGLLLIRRGFAPALKRADIQGVRWNDLRHTFSTWLSTRCTFTCLRDCMAHSPGKLVTLNYTHTPWDEKKKAIDSLPDILPTGQPGKACEHGG